jgi:acyl carrier protein
MLSLRMSQKELFDIIEMLDMKDVSISCFNGPNDIVLSGAITQLDALRLHVHDAHKCSARLLNVPVGYHSAAVEPILNDIVGYARTLTLKPPQVTFFSTTLKSFVEKGEMETITPEYFAFHCRNPVHFDGAIEKLLVDTSDSPFNIWIEIGPRVTVSPYIRANKHASLAWSFVESLRQSQEPMTTLTSSLAHLHNLGAPIRWRKLFEATYKPACLSLPSYPFAMTRFWVSYRELHASMDLPRHPMLASWIQHPVKTNDWTAVFETPIYQLKDLITGHRVGGVSLCPASVYLELVHGAVRAGIRQAGLRFSDYHITLHDVRFIQYLVYEEYPDRILTTTVNVNGTTGNFSVTSRQPPLSEEVTHAQGVYRLRYSEAGPAYSTSPCESDDRFDVYAQEIFSSRTIYEVVFPRVVEYSKSYRLIENITVDGPSMNGFARASYPSLESSGAFIVNPFFLDSVLHTAGFIANLRGSSNTAYICSFMGEATVISQRHGSRADYCIRCHNARMSDDNTFFVDVDVTDIDDFERPLISIRGMQFRHVHFDRFKRGLLTASRSRSSSLSLNKTASPISPLNITLQQYFSHKDEQHLRSKLNLVVDAVATICNLTPSDVTADTDLTSIGVDPLLLSEVITYLQDKYPSATLSLSAFSMCRTVWDLQSELRATLLSTNRCSGDASSLSQVSENSSPRTLVTEDVIPENWFSQSTEHDKRIVIRQTLAEVLEIGEEDVDDKMLLEDLGLDSLSSIEASYALQERFDVALPGNLFSTHKTVGEVSAYIIHLHANIPNYGVAISSDYHIQNDALREATRPGKLSLSLIREGESTATPLVLLHDGSGLISHYYRLSIENRAIWAIATPACGGYSTIYERSQAYASLVQSQMKEPIIIGGERFRSLLVFSS